VPTQATVPPATAYSSNTNYHPRQRLANRDLDMRKHQATVHTGEADIDYSAMNMDHHGSREPEGESDYLVGKAPGNNNQTLPSYTSINLL
jgi:hypothetical protein